MSNSRPFSTRADHPLASSRAVAPTRERGRVVEGARGMRMRRARARERGAGHARGEYMYLIRVDLYSSAYVIV